MKHTIYLFMAALILASCGGKKNGGDHKQAELDSLKNVKTKVDERIAVLEKDLHSTDSGKVTPVSVMEVQPTDFIAYLNIQASITGDENVLATPQMPGIVSQILVHSGQSVVKGQTLAILDAAAVEQQIKGQDVQLTLAKALYEKQKALWQQNIGTEVQYMSSKATYEAADKQRAALIAQRDMYKIVAPISGAIDAMSLKIGDVASPGTVGIRVVSFDKLRADASLGESYLGKVKQGDNVILVFPDINDSIKTRITNVSQAVDPTSRAFTIQVNLANNHRIHPNMSCIMKIGNYEKTNALVVPVSVIQKTSKGDMVYVVKGDKAESLIVKTGENSNGRVEILSGLQAGDKVVTAGYEELDNGQQVLVK